MHATREHTKASGSRTARLAAGLALALALGGCKREAPSPQDPAPTAAGGAPTRSGAAATDGDASRGASQEINDEQRQRAAAGGAIAGDGGVAVDGGAAGDAGVVPVTDGGR
jgi:hypothetical protein